MYNLAPLYLFFSVFFSAYGIYEFYDELTQDFVVDKGFNIELRECDFSSLHYFCAAGLIENVEKMILEGANINEVHVGNITPLHCACLCGNLEIAKLLLMHGADIDIKMQNKFTPVMLAAYSGDIKLVKFLLSRLVNFKDDVFQFQFLDFLYKTNKTEILQLIIAYKMAYKIFYSNEVKKYKINNNNLLESLSIIFLDKSSIQLRYTNLNNSQIILSMQQAYQQLKRK